MPEALTGPAGTASTQRDAFATNGVVHLPGLLDAAGLGLARAAYDWSIAHPSPAASHAFGGKDGAFYQDLCHPEAAAHPAYRELLETTPLAPTIAELWGDPRIWFMYEQVFLKEGGLASTGGARRTPWHQDSSYLAVDGPHLAVAWISFDPVGPDEALEFVRGSHLGPLYNTSAFDPADETRPIREGADRLPDIEADRAAFDIVSWPVEPGDVVVFHPAMLHGGGPTLPGQRRRTLSLRFFGADAVYATRPTGAAGPLVRGLHRALRPGDPFRFPAFPELTIPTPSETPGS